MRMTTAQGRDTPGHERGPRIRGKGGFLCGMGYQPMTGQTWAGSACYFVPVFSPAHDEPARPNYPAGRVRRVDGARVAGRAHDAGTALQGGREAGDAVAGAVRAVGVHADRG